MLNVDLFENIENNQILELLKCIGIKTKTFKKDSYIIKAGQKINFLCVILEGSVQSSKNNTIIETFKINDIFGHNIVCCGINKSPVNYVAKENSEVLFLPFEKIVTPCSKLCIYHLQMIKNIMKMISKRNSFLFDKLDIIAQKTTRDKILALLETYKPVQGEIFSIPYSREEMAKFLCVDRSALSRELSRMRDDGILKFYKNNFEFLVRT